MQRRLRYFFAALTIVAFVGFFGNFAYSARVLHPPTMSGTDLSYTLGAPIPSASVTMGPKIQVDVLRNDRPAFVAALHRDVVAHGGWAVGRSAFIVPDQYLPRLQQLDGRSDYHQWFDESPAVQTGSSQWVSVSIAMHRNIFEYQWLEVTFMMSAALMLVGGFGALSVLGARPSRPAAASQPV